MRFTKIPLIATLMAVALSLLIVLPTLAQVSGDRTDGRLSVGDWIDVRVADNLGDIDSNTAATTTVQDQQRPTLSTRLRQTKRRPTTRRRTPTSTATSTSPTTRTPTTPSSSLRRSSTAIESMLITTIPNDGEETCASGVAAAVATIKNDRSGTRVTAYLVDSGSQETNGDRDIYQGIVAVWDQEDSIEANNANCQPTNADHGDPEKYVDSEEQRTEATVAEADTDSSGGRRRRTSGILRRRQRGRLDEAPAPPSSPHATATPSPSRSTASPAASASSSTATSLRSRTSLPPPAARRTAAPSTSASPSATTAPVSATTASPAPAETPTSPRRTATATSASTNRSPPTVAMAPPRTSLSTSVTAAGAMTDVSQYGSNGWTQNVKGVSYDLDMRLVGKGFDKYYWQVTASRTASATWPSPTPTRTRPAPEPFSFTVDDQGPWVALARTGIGYEAGEGEFKNRSWIALNFINEDARTADRIDSSTVAPSRLHGRGPHGHERPRPERQEGL